MPNWCYQRMLVTGDDKEISRFIGAIKEDEPDKYDMNKLVPLDPRATAIRKSTNQDGETIEYSVFAERNEDGFDGYGHALEVWGSKWGACSIRIDEPTERPLDLRFDSAWGPADQLIRQISGQFPTLTFGICFTEESDAFAGWLVFRNNELVAEGEVSTEIPEGIEELLETNEDEYYEKLMEYQNDKENSVFDLMEADMENVSDDVEEVNK